MAAVAKGKNFALTVPSVDTLRRPDGWYSNPDVANTWWTIRHHLHMHYTGQHGGVVYGEPQRNLSVTAPGVTATTVLTVTEQVEIVDTRETMREILLSDESVKRITSQLRAGWGDKLPGALSTLLGSQRETRRREQESQRSTDRTQSTVSRTESKQYTFEVAATDPPSDCFLVPSYALEQWDVHLEHVDWLTFALRRKVFKAQRIKTPSHGGTQQENLAPANVGTCHALIGRISMYMPLGFSPMAGGDPRIGQVRSPDAATVVEYPTWTPLPDRCFTEQPASLYKITEATWPPRRSVVLDM